MIQFINIYSYDLYNEDAPEGQYGVNFTDTMTTLSPQVPGRRSRRMCMLAFFSFCTRSRNSPHASPHPAHA